MVVYRCSVRYHLLPLFIREYAQLFVRQMVESMNVIQKVQIENQPVIKSIISPHIHQVRLCEGYRAIYPFCLNLKYSSRI